MNGNSPVETTGTVRFVKGPDEAAKFPPLVSQRAGPKVTSDNDSAAASSRPSDPVQRPRSPATPATESAEGAIRRLAEKDLLLQISPETVLRFRLLAKTEFRGEDGKPVRDSLLRPGDRVAVNVSPDDVETAISVILVKSASASEREAASAPVEEGRITAPDPSNFAGTREAAASDSRPPALSGKAPPVEKNLKLTFKAVSAKVSFNGAPAATVDLTVDLVANTAKLVTGGGHNGSDRYLNLQGFFSSRALGLSNVEATTLLAVHMGDPMAAAPFRNSTALLVSGNVVNGIFNMRGIETWNRISSIGPLLGSATASGPLNVLLKNGKTLSITTFEDAEPFGHASFQATYDAPAEASVASDRPPMQQYDSTAGIIPAARSVAAFDTPAKLLSHVDPEYSEEARKARWVGNVRLSLVVDESGNPTDIKVVQSLGLGLDEKAVEAVQKWRWTPGMKDAKPVKVTVEVEVAFRLL